MGVNGARARWSICSSRGNHECQGKRAFFEWPRKPTPAGGGEGEGGDERGAGRAGALGMARAAARAPRCRCALVTVALPRRSEWRDWQYSA